MSLRPRVSQPSWLGSAGRARAPRRNLRPDRPDASDGAGSEPSPAPTLRRSLIVAFVSFTLLLLGQGVSGVLGLQYVADAALTVSTTLTPALDANAAVRAELLVVSSQPTKPISPERRQRMLDNLDSVSGADLGAQLDPLLKTERQAVDAWLTRPGDAQRFTAALRSNSAVAAHLENQRVDLWEQVRALRVFWLFGLGATGLVGLLLVSYTAVRMVGWFSRPLRDVAHGLERLRLGDVQIRVNPRGPREVQMVGSAVNHLAEQTALVRALREESTRLRRGTLDGALAVREKIEYDDVVQAGLSAIADTLEVDLVWFLPVEADSLGPSAGWWAEPTFGAVVDVQAVVDRQRVSLSLSQLGDMWSDGLVHVSADVDWVPRELGKVEGGAAAFGHGTVIKVPLVAGNELMGCAALLDSRGPRELSGEEVSALLVMASNTAVGLQHSRMFANQQDLVHRLQELDRQKTAFMSNVSHELRTPLTSIAGYTEMLTDGDAGPITGPMVGMLEAIDRNTTRLGLLIDDLLALSRIESAGHRIVATQVQVSTLVARAVETVTPQVRTKGLSLTVEPGQEHLAITGDAGQLERCLLNLLSNAVKFTPEGGAVEVTVRTLNEDTEAPQVVLSVTDSGIGIPKADQEHLFTRFFRASNAVAHEIPGTGLGLTIVRGIIEHHGGRMEVESDAGRGTTVRLLLPRRIQKGDTENGWIGIPSQRTRGISGPPRAVEH